MKSFLKLKVCLFFIYLITYNSNAQAPTDCVDAIIVCGNSEINLNVGGVGMQELTGLNNCDSEEHNSLWLKVTLVTDGTLGFILTPNSTDINEDYDFFVFGPNSVCGNLSPAIRCSTTNPQAANQGNNLTGMRDTPSNLTSGGPGPVGDSFVEWLTVTAGETYFIVIDRPIGNSSFNLEWIGTAQFASPPTNEASNIPGTNTLNLENCDMITPKTDGQTTFDLSVNTKQIIGSQMNVSVDYFISESDANINVNPITGLFTNIINPQEVYAKITNDNTGCFEIIPFKLTVSPGPDFSVPSDYNLCDNFDDGDASNGQIIFDLASKDEEILNGQSASELNISYHNSQVDADTGTNPHPDSYYNQTPFQEGIFVRIENVLETSCYSTTSFNLIVNLLPLASNSSLLQCDEDGNKDGRTAFNLDEAFDALSVNSTIASIEYYTNQSDVENGSNMLDALGYINTSNPQIVFAKIIDNTTLCFSVAELSLEVSTTQINNYQAPEVCEDIDAEDGIHTFDLNTITTAIQQDNNVAFPITYYDTYKDALLEQNPLITPYANLTPYNQVIYSRAENNNACYGIGEVALTVTARPKLAPNETVLYCLNTFPQNILLSAGIVNDSPSNYTYVWSSGDTTNRISINEIGTYTVTATNSSGCTQTRFITVEPSNIATIETINVQDGQQDNNTIIVIATGEGEYEFALFDAAGSLFADYQTSNEFTNVSPGIYTASVRDIKNNCGLVNSMVSVIGFPKFFTPNGDGANDTWNIKGISEHFQPNSRILIFDRYGKLLKELNPTGNGWDGSYNGQTLPNDDYWFSVKLQDGRIFKSHFTLKR
ncbi:T9SS type B sorting domain-containing protein [Bizionia argentinensis]|uniref:T9SS type B sorting domain-containing protein n=1 Tax=Bizionia argentinensis TaxID=456455 RepID=UPI0002230C77|nr:T9SS type B sorting domain-containing protein [Bizionia argentinensis]